MALPEPTSDHETEIADRPCQKIRTIELDGKTVKLQIVCAAVIRFHFADADMSASGTLQVKNDSEPSHPPTTAEHMASALSTM